MIATRVGGTSAIDIREERVRSEHAGGGTTLVYASDLHLRRNDHAVAEALFETIARARPDVVLLGGDLVDSPRGHELLAALVRDLARLAPVLAVPGNHDVFWGASVVAEAVRQGGGHWIPEELVHVPTRGGAIAIAGHAARFVDLEGATRVLLGHDPAVLDDAATHAADVVLAGHLHGGQLVLAQRSDRLYPGALFYRYCGLRFVHGRTTMLVSRGVGDTLPFRFRCPREVLRVEVSS